MENIKHYKVIVACLFITGIQSLKIILNSILGILTRKKVDAISKEWAQKLVKEIELDLKIEGLENVSYVKNQAYIFMSNHLSLYDIPIALSSFPGSIRMLAKKEMKNYPLLGQAMTSGEYLFIDRKNFKSALQDLKHAEEKMKNGIRVWIYPEGTRSADGKIKNFKKGGFHLAIQSKAIIIPVCILGSGDILPPHSYNLKTGQKVLIKVGHPIKAEDYSKDSVEQLKEKTESIIRNLHESSFN